MSLKIKLNIVNKKEYELNEDYREIVIKIPKESEELEKDFKYLGLDYNNLSIQDSHVLDCEVIDTNDPAFSASISQMLFNIIEKANTSGYTTPYQDIKAMFTVIRSLDGVERDMLLAVLELKRKEICNMKDAVRFVANLDNYKFYAGIETSEQYAKELIKNNEIKIQDIEEYIDMEHLGDDYCSSEAGVFTKHGLIFENAFINKLKNITSKNKEVEESEEYE